MPVFKEITPEEKLPAEVTEDVPVITDHIPVPVVGDIAASVAAEAQTV